MVRMYTPRPPRRQSLEGEEKRLWRGVEAAALDAAAQARLGFRRRRDAQLMSAAQQASRGRGAKEAEACERASRSACMQSVACLTCHPCISSLT